MRVRINCVKKSWLEFLFSLDNLVFVWIELKKRE